MNVSFSLLGRHRPDDYVVVGLSPRTAARLLRDVHAIARRLPARAEGAELVLVCRDRYAFAASMLAAWERGYVVALPAHAQPQAVTELRRSPAVTTVLHDVEGMAGIDVRRLIDDPDADLDLGSVEPIVLAADRPLVVVYTSGSTGAPVACPKTAGQLVGEAELLARSFGIHPGDRVLATVPPHHIYGLLFGVLVPLISGAACVRETTLHAEPLASAIARDGVTVLVSVPAHLRALRVLEAGRIPPLARVFSSGAPLPAETSEDLASRFGWTVTEVLGSSETGGIAWRDRPGARWTPFESVHIGQDEAGRMTIDSPFVDPGATRPWVGGDRIALGPDGRFEHLGRADGVLKVGSTRVSIAELEARLLAVQGVTDAAVIAVEVGGARGWESWAVVAGEGLTQLGVRAALSEWLDPVVLPRRVRVVASLPREATGKLRRDALRALFDDEGRS